MYKDLIKEYDKTYLTRDIIKEVLEIEDFNVLDEQILVIKANILESKIIDQGYIKLIEDVSSKLFFLKEIMELKHRIVGMPRNVLDVREYIINLYKNLKDLRIALDNNSDYTLINDYRNMINDLISNY